MIRLLAEGRVGGFDYAAAFEGPAPGVTAILGPSGSGKTTLLRVAAGLTRPANGRLDVAGETVFDLASGLWPAPERRRCALVFQEGRLFPHRDVRANLLYGYQRAGSERPLQPDAVIEGLGLAALLARRPRTLSAGERQRVAIGRALLAQPRLLALDEPLANLDAALRAQALALIASLPRRFGVTVLYVTHALDEAAALGDALVLMERGRAVAAGPIGAVLGDPDGPLAQRPDARTAWTGAVTRVAHAQGVATIAINGAEVLAPSRDLTVGAAVRLQIFADDVVLGRGAAPQLSLRNALPGRITRLKTRADGSILAALSTALGPDHLLAAVTAGAMSELGLKEGDEVTALFKAAALTAQSQP